MRIMQFIIGIDVGGAEMAMLRMSCELRRRGHDIQVYCIRRQCKLEREFTKIGVPVYYFSPVAGLFETLKHAREFKAEVLQSWMPHANLLGLLLGRLVGKPKVVWNIRQTLNRWRQIPALTRRVIRCGARFSRRADAIIYNSGQGRKDHESHGYRNKSSLVIPNGFEALPIDPELRQQTRSQLGLSSDGLAILFVGRDHPDKGPDFFIDAAIRLARENAKAEFILVGRGFGVSSARLKRIPSELQGRFHFLGEVTELALTGALQAGDVFTSTSISEGFPNALAETMLLENIPVVTDVGDSPTIIGECGIVVPPGDSAAIVDSWHRLAQMPPEERNVLKRQCRMRILKEFSLEVCINSYERLYRELSEK
jgi:glycosyltransferase involved in cell wall biosynthesis